MKAMKQGYGAKKGKQVFYASKNKGVISGVEKGFYGHMNPMDDYTHIIKTTGHANVYGSHKEAE